jgi:hypothetical protein
VTLKHTLIMLGLGAATCIGGAIVHCTPAVILGCCAGGVSCLTWLAVVLAS